MQSSLHHTLRERSGGATSPCFVGCTRRESVPVPSEDCWKLNRGGAQVGKRPSLMCAEVSGKLREPNPQKKIISSTTGFFGGGHNRIQGGRAIASYCSEPRKPRSPGLLHAFYPRQQWHSISRGICTFVKPVRTVSFRLVAVHKKSLQMIFWIL